MNRAHRQRDVISISLLLLAITIVMYLGEGRWAAAPALRYLYLIPIAHAAMGFGVMGSMAVAILADLLFAPLVATSLTKYGLVGAPTIEIIVTLVLMPVLAYFAGSGWGRLSRQRELYQFLSRMGDLFGRSLPRDQLLGEILQQGGTLIDAQAGEIILLEQGQARIAASWGFEAQATAAYQTSLAAYILKRNEPWSATSLENNSDFQRVGFGQRIDAALAVPLRLEGKPIGLLAFYNRLGGFSKQEQATVEAMGSKVEVVLENFRQIEERSERARLQREFDLAAEVQQRFLPQQLPAISGYEIAGFTQPAREVGGDFFNVIDLSDDRWYLGVGDVSGKGVVGAFFMAIAMSVIDLYLHDSPPSNQLSLANRLNPLFYRRMAQQKINTGLAYAMLDAKSGQLQLGNAGLISPLHMRKDGQCEYLDLTGFPLGAVANAQYHEAALELQAGESLIFVSDGVVEAANSQRELFGLNRLRNLISMLSQRPAAQLVNEIMSAANHWSDGQYQDDMTVVVLRRN
ncbi:PP2C family protein-serine/threonine phosphatase [Herpetosiphon geysericola]|uniref:PPM-type phosphatase domain-containing protein n=1 Tax=Herpetosiphon geysericola TaxID=70996 RepID=A0A0P6Y1A2_9CHLR|nr:GAF domain-containing SpoIIE family protein phosphatase [Herpetosiphon geysericola]KPL91318.1 hypothetical protein SE18_02510 [Herpetosiphon geysericola]